MSVHVHSTLNTGCGVISELDLLYSAKEEILENIKEQNVAGVRRLYIEMNEPVFPTKHQLFLQKLTQGI